MLRLPVLAILLLILAGCGPSGCRATDPHALLPADSLSRAFAETVPALELEYVSEIDLVGVADHPRTMLFTEDGRRLLIGDTRSHFVAEVDIEGGTSRRIESASFRNPYLVGFRTDTLLVMNPARRHIEFIHSGESRRQIELPDLDDRRTLRYATVFEDEIYLKSVSDSQGSILSRFSMEGEELDRAELEGPFWRHSGNLRQWGDAVISLSGYRPVVDFVGPDMRLDSLLLLGFDSPMLSRSRRFIEGDARNAPLLTSSGSPLGDHLWILNMRPGWIQIDAYDRDGRLLSTYTQPEPAPDRRFYPVDLIAEADEDGSTLLHVLLARPDARVVTYRARLP
jgi:hypothetical protein